MKASPRKNQVNFRKALFWPVLIAVILPLIKTFFASDPLVYMIPNFLLFTSFRDLTKWYWRKFIHINTAVTYEPNHVPVIEAKDYTYENLRVATQNFRYPALVKGLFNNTPALKNWDNAQYLAEKIGDFKIPVVLNAQFNTRQDERAVIPFSEAITQLYGDKESKMYLFFPVKSRFNLNGSDIGSLERLQKKLDSVIIDDLQVDKIIWNGFGTKIHKSFIGGQFVIGQGSDDERTTGTGWHCAPGSNWFVQVIGRKRWYFLDPKYGANLYPVRGGLHNFQTSNHMTELQKHLPLRYADLQPGDLLYNPDWEWHTIKNYDGLSFGVPIREINITYSFRNNLQYSSIVTVNKLLMKLGYDIGGYASSV